MARIHAVRLLFSLALLPAVAALAAEVRPELVPQVGHGDPVMAVAYSPDGRLLASGSWDSTVRVWDTQTGEVRRVLTGHTRLVGAVAFSRNGRLASGGNDGTVQVWDLTTGRSVWARPTGRPQVISVAFSPDGRTVATGDAGYVSERRYAVRLWDAATGEPRRELDGASGEITAVAYSPDGLRLAAAGADRYVRVWDAGAGALVQSLQSRFPPQAIAFSGNGRSLIAGSYEHVDGKGHGELALWDVATGQVKQSAPAGSVRSIALSADGNTLAEAELEARVRLWDTDAWKPRPGAPEVFSSARSVAMAPDGRSFAAASDDGIALCDVATGRVFRQLIHQPGKVTSLAFSRSGKLLVAGHGKGAPGADAVRVWDPTSGALQRTLPVREGWVYTVGVAADGRTIAAGSVDRKLRRWDARTGQPVAEPLELSAAISSLAYSPDGRLLAAATGEFAKQPGDAPVVVLRDSRGGVERVLAGHTKAIYAVAFSPDGTTLASGSFDRTVRLWDVRSGECRATLTGHARGLNAVAFSPNGSVLASGGGDYFSDGPGEVKLWDARSGALLSTLTGMRTVMFVGFSPDGRLLAAGGNDGQVRIWNAVTGTLLRTLEPHSGWVGALAFSPNGKVLATGSGGDRIHLWDPQTGRLRATLLPLTAPRSRDLASTAAEAAPAPEEWLAFTPEGYYAGSKGAPARVRWAAGGNLFPAEQFARRYADAVRVATALRD